MQFPYHQQLHQKRELRKLYEKKSLFTHIDAKIKKKTVFFWFRWRQPQVAHQAYKAKYARREQSVSCKPFIRSVVLEEKLIS